MINIIARIEKAEAAARPVVRDDRALLRVIGVDDESHKYYIDGAQVVYSVYEKAEREQIAATKARGEDVSFMVTVQ